ncbi:hypothetical protein ABZY93_20125 [Streptomyces smyrnaeus]|uniref:hypothetical protein n=1 Tax=Streptomyces smyrnaeus TaxID=1387713 RepID=UPI0033BF52EB
MITGSSVSGGEETPVRELSVLQPNGRLLLGGQHARDKSRVAASAFGDDGGSRRAEQASALVVVVAAKLDGGLTPLRELDPAGVGFGPAVCPGPLLRTSHSLRP